MTTYFYLIDKLKDAILNEPFTTTCTTGSLDDIDNYKQTLFPLAHIIVNSFQANGNVITANVSILFMDIVDISKDEVTDIFRGNDNEQEVLNTQFNAAMRIYELARRGELFNNEIWGGETATIEPFTERFENYLAGVTITLDIILRNDMSIC